MNKYRSKINESAVKSEMAPRGCFGCSTKCTGTCGSGCIKTCASGCAFGYKGSVTAISKNR